MTNDKVIEAVARALCNWARTMSDEPLMSDDEWTRLNPWEAELLHTQAQAAIEAARPHIVAETVEQCIAAVQGERLRDSPDNPGDEGYMGALDHAEAAAEIQGRAIARDCGSRQERKVTSTTPEAIADLCERLRRCRDAYIPVPNQLPHTRVLQVNAVPHSMNPDGAEAAATIEKLQAERDAALAEVEEAKDHIESCERTIAAVEAERDAALAEGARQATAAIVAYTKRLRHDEAFYRVCVEMDNLADRYERGYHLKETGQ